MNKTIINLILTGIVFAVFMIALSSSMNSRGVKQQVLEKEIALLVDASVPEMEFWVEKKTFNGVIQKVEVRDGKVFVAIDGLPSLKGYPYFSRYNVLVEDDGDKFKVKIR